MKKIAAILPNDPTTYTASTIGTVIAEVIRFATTVAGSIAVIYIIVGAFMYFTAYGNEEKANKAKTILLYAIIGLMIILVSKVLIAEFWNTFSSQPFI